MGCLSRSVRSAFTFILSILQIAIGLYIIYTVSADLYKVTIETDTSTGKATTNETCFLETEVSTLNLCRLVIAGVSFTFAASFVLSIIQCFTCNCCGCGWLFDTLLAGFLAAVWSVLAVYLKNADDELESRSTPYSWDTDSVANKRTAVVYLSIVEAGLFGISALIGLSSMCPDSDNYKD